MKSNRKKGKAEEVVKPFSKAVEVKFRHFVEYHPPKRLAKNLRSMLLDFLMSEGATEVHYLQDLLHDLDGLFELLDTIESDDSAAAA
jgi:hypothetical protein